MQLTIAKENLARLLYLTNTIVERRNTMPILANVRLTAGSNNALNIAATDLEVSLVGETDAEVKNPGSITVSAKFLYDIVRELPSESVTLKASDGERLEIESGNSKFKINGISSEEYPSIMGVTLTKPISIEAETLAEVIDKTSYAVSQDETRYNLNGVYVETLEAGAAKGKQIVRFVATDGHRLALVEREADGFNLPSGVIIPRKGITELRKVLEDNTGAARVSIDKGFFTVESGRVVLGIRLIDGEFPDYRQVIPQQSVTTVEADRADLLATVRRVSLVTTDKSRSVRLALTKGSLLVSSSSPEYGEASETISVQQTGEDVTIGFSAKYIVDLLSSMSKSEVVSLKLNGELGPGVFVGDADEQYRCIVMPMRFE